ncbi:hypothetical protein EFP84_04760 [Leptospira kmetyi]|uniref:Uncharacterized protein n=1 Tax=Leptospira kmetyi TaxID=408139 RepID=A0AAD0XN08_9LEPT|nr:hypothetical protein EFP84_04760 [Leptospira kmetyi]
MVDPFFCGSFVLSGLRENGKRWIFSLIRVDLFSKASFVGTIKKKFLIQDFEISRGSLFRKFHSSLKRKPVSCASYQTNVSLGI